MKSNLAKRLLSLVVFLLPNLVISQTLININTPLDSKAYNERAEYIIKYAPSDSALNVLHSMGTAHLITGTNSKARFIFKTFRKYFEMSPSYLNNIDYNIMLFSQRMLFDTYTQDQEFAFIDMMRDEAPNEEGFLALQRVVGHYINEKKWDSAIYLYTYYSPLFPYYNNRIEDIISILKTPIEGLEIENLGPRLNTSRNEWDPNPTPDGKYFYYTTEANPKGKGDDDVFASIIDSTGNWSETFSISDSINSRKKETIDNISTDGNILILSGTFDGSKRAFDIYTSNRVKNGWTKPAPLQYPINTEFHDEGGYLTSDGKALIFTSDRPGSLWKLRRMGEIGHGSRDGNMDIYVSIKSDTGWSQPINLGTSINTPFAERAPFLHPDGKTLYFSSDGHPGLGRLDLFKSTRLSDENWTEWSKPINLGKEINTGNDDWGYTITTDGNKAYFAGLNRPEGYGGWDLYSITMPRFGRPGEVAVVEGKIIDNFGNPIAANIVWEDLETGEVIGKLTSNPDDGSYYIVLLLGSKYGYFAQKDGYYSSSKNIDLINNNSGETIYEDIVLVSKDELLNNSVKIRLNNIFFDSDKSELKKESFYEINRLIDFLSDSRNINILIEGHTDNQGDNSYNQFLSQERAKAVANYIISHSDYLRSNNITITPMGYGSTRPIDTNTTSEGRAKNRRVELSIRSIVDK